MSRLEDLADSLNQAIDLVESALAERGFGVTASIKLADSGCLLVFGKLDHVWRLMIQTPDGTVHPLRNCSRMYRVEAMDYLDELHAALSEAAGQNVEEVKDAISKAQDFFRKINR